MKATIAGAVLAVTAVSVTPTPGQVLQIERRAYSHLMELRTELVAAWSKGDAELRTRLGAALESDAQGNPFVPTARALAVARGVACDPEFLFRTAIHCFALPEILDPAEFQELSVTMHLPFTVPLPGKLRFELFATDADGKRRALWRITENTALEDLERFRAVARIPVAELGDLRRLSAAVVPATNATDPGVPNPSVHLEPSAPVQVVPGFKARVEALRLARSELGTRAGVRDLAVLDGALAMVDRVWDGEPRAGDNEAINDLRAAERMAANLREHRAPLAGLAKAAPFTELQRVTIGVAFGPGAGAAWTASVALGATASRPRWLLVVLPGTPIWPTHLGGPTSPEATPPGLVLDHLLAMQHAKLADARVVVLESPGRIRDPATSLAKVCGELREIFDCKSEPLVVLAEREGATVAAMALVREPKFADAVVLVDGGSFQPTDFDRSSTVPMLGIAARHQISSENLRRANRLARARGLTAFELIETDLLPRDFAVAAALEPGLDWIDRQILLPASRPSTARMK